MGKSTRLDDLVDLFLARGDFDLIVVLAALVGRYSNIVIARICRVSEAAVRKWLKAAGIVRTKRCVSTEEMPDRQVALLRADLRQALSRETG
jgi:hypothetical protein